jgi:hypothetical protein
MYYKESIIHGNLHYRITPDGPWLPYTTEELTALITSLRNDIKDHCKKMEELIHTLS